MFNYGPILTAVIEVKVTRSDFLRERKTKFERSAPANLCYLAYPKGVLKTDEVPRGWQGFEADINCNRLNRKHWTYPTVHPQHPGNTAEFLLALAARTDRRTRYARWRYVAKMQRAGMSERKI